MLLAQRAEERKSERDGGGPPGPNRPLAGLGFSWHEMEAYRKIDLFCVSKDIF